MVSYFYEFIKLVADPYLALMALKWRHAGQACITANRVYVQSGVYDKFAELFKEKTAKLVVGHGAEKGTTMGPVTTPRSLDRALNQVDDAKKHGGQIVLGGGKVIGKSGYFFEPTIILGAKKEMLITQEETFAPILALYSFDTEDEAVEAANNTSVSQSKNIIILPNLLVDRWDLLHTFSPKTLIAHGDSWRILKLA
jgi:succinate-semialdehyde dehydrogenase/glutarate-semialdehyde dehydrogenase